ncbi:cation transporter [Desulforamulus putei]|uniref:cation transporter n=1 Tax=Desulforamulus putei TaxID=74701 RepID=UPI002FDEF7B0
MGNGAVLEFRLEGLSCADCAVKLERQIASLPGVQETKLNFTAAKLTVYGDMSADAVISEARRDGVKAIPAGEYKEQTGANFWTKNRWATTSAIAGLLLALGWCLDYVLETETAARTLYLACIAAGGFAVGRKALLSLSRFRLDMNVLMGVAVTGAILIGELILHKFKGSAPEPGADPLPFLIWGQFNVLSRTI